MATRGPPPRPFSVSTRGSEDDVVYVQLHGDVDLASADLVRSALHAAVARAPALVVVDLTSVDTLDSTGLGALIGAAKRAGDTCEVALLAPGGLYVRGVLSLSGLLGQMTVFESEEQVRRYRSLA